VQNCVIVRDGSWTDSSNEFHSDGPETEKLLCPQPAFHKHVSIVARSCNYHAHAIRHIRHLLMTDLAQPLACSLILSRIDYCNAVLHGAPTGTIRKLQQVQNNAARIVLQAPSDSTLSRYCTSCIGCQSSSRSHSFEFWHTKFGARPLRFIYTAKSQNVLAAELNVPLPFHCWTNRSWEQTSLSALSGLQHRLSGTRCHKQFSSVILRLF